MESDRRLGTRSIQVVYEKLYDSKSVPGMVNWMCVFLVHSPCAGKERTKMGTPRWVRITASLGELVRYVYLGLEVVIMI